MKRIILIISIAVVCFPYIKAQNVKCNYLCFIQTIDSLKTALRRGETIQVSKQHWNFNDLSIEERSQVLDYLETLFHQTDYMSFYHLGLGLFVDLFDNDDRKTQDRIARLYLDKAFYFFDSEFTNLGKVVDYSDETKERLKNILERNKTEEDIEARTRLARRDIKRKYHEEIDRKVKKMIQENKIKGKEAEMHLTDSLTNVYVEKRIRWMEDHPPLERFTILQIGSSNDLRFVDGLEKILATDYVAFRPDDKVWADRMVFLKEACTYALAKLGVQEYLDTVYAQKSVNYEYLGTKEAFLKELDKQFVWNKSSYLFSNQKPRPSALIILEEAIMYYLKNVPVELKKDFWYLVFVVPEKIEDYDPDKDEQNKESIKTAYKLYNWIKDNPDKWEMPPASDRF